MTCTRSWTFCKACGVVTMAKETAISARRISSAKASCLVLTAGNVIMIDKQDVIDAADDAGICICGIEPVAGTELPIETLASYATSSEEERPASTMLEIERGKSAG